MNIGGWNEVRLNQSQNTVENCPTVVDTRNIVVFPPCLSLWYTDWRGGQRAVSPRFDVTIGRCRWMIPPQPLGHPLSCGLPVCATISSLRAAVCCITAFR